MPEGIYPHLKNIIIERYRTNWDKSLLHAYELDRDFLRIDPGIVRFAISNRERILSALDEPALKSILVDLFVNYSTDFTYKSNQFIYITSRDERGLKDIYRSYLSDMRRTLASQDTPAGLEEKMTALLKGHFLNLRGSISKFVDTTLPGGIGNNLIFQRAVCCEYSPAFQLSILGIDLAHLIEPILDLGCGKSGQLVKYLNALGLQAVGVDRSVADSDHLIRSDWLALPVQPDFWGTIISHMAFSNFFIFHHLYRDGVPDEYARGYMRILAGLKVGGSFYYAPGLPFIEKHLPRADYSIRRCRIKSCLPDGGDLGGMIDDDVFYASQITKKHSSCPTSVRDVVEESDAQYPIPDSPIARFSDYER